MRFVLKTICLFLVLAAASVLPGSPVFADEPTAEEKPVETDVSSTPVIGKYLKRARESCDITHYLKELEAAEGAILFARRYLQENRETLSFELYSEMREDLDTAQRALDREWSRFFPPGAKHEAPSLIYSERLIDEWSASAAEQCPTEKPGSLQESLVPLQEPNGGDHTDRPGENEGPADIASVPENETGSDDTKTPSPASNPGNPAKSLLVITAGAVPYDGPPVLEVRVNGTLIETITVTDPTMKLFVLEIPPDLTPVEELRLRFANDLYEGSGKDRNLLIGRVFLGDQELSLGSARYERDTESDIAGQGDMMWQGELVFDFK